MDKIDRLRQVLDELAIKKSNSGYFYLVDAFLLLDEGENIRKFSITKLYAKIAILNNVSATSVERAIRQARKNYDVTNKEFIVDMYIRVNGI